MNLDWLKGEIDSGVRKVVKARDVKQAELIEELHRRIMDRIIFEYNESLDRIRKSVNLSLDREREIVS